MIMQLFAEVFSALVTLVTRASVGLFHAFTQQYLDKVSLSNKSEQKPVGSTYSRYPIYIVIFPAEVTLYQEQWNRVTEVES